MCVVNEPWDLHVLCSSRKVNEQRWNVGAQCRVPGPRVCLAFPPGLLGEPLSQHTRRDRMNQECTGSPHSHPLRADGWPEHLHLQAVCPPLRHVHADHGWPAGQPPGLRVRGGKRAGGVWGGQGPRRESVGGRPRWWSVLGPELPSPHGSSCVARNKKVHTSWNMGAILEGDRSGFARPGPKEQLSRQMILKAEEGDCDWMYGVLRDGLASPDVADMQGYTVLAAAAVSTPPLPRARAGCRVLLQGL